MSMGFKLFVFVLCVNLILALVQASILSINPDAPRFSSTSAIERYSAAAARNLSVFDTLPDSTPASLPSTGVGTTSVGTLFTDPLNTIKAWYSEKITRIPVVGPTLTFFEDIVKAPYTLCTLSGIPTTLTYLIVGAWWALTAVSLMLMFVGRD